MSDLDPSSVLRALGGTSSGATTLPNIPSVPSTSDPAINSFLTSVKTWMDAATGSGLTGFATRQELVNAGVISPTGSTGTATTATELSVPPVPTGLTAVGAMTNILVKWDDPSRAFSNYGYTEIWASGDSSFSDAVMVGTSLGFTFSHAVGEDSTRYYWIRYVSSTGVKGPYNAVQGTEASTSKSPDFLMSVLTSAYGSTSSSPFFQIDKPTVINGIEVPAGTYLQTAFIAAASITTAQIANANIDAANITGKLTADQIDASNLNVSAANVTGQITARQINGYQLSIVNGYFSGTLLAGTIDPSTMLGVSYTNSIAGTYTFTVTSSYTSIRYNLLGAGGGGAVGQYGEWDWAAGGGGGGGAGQQLTGILNNLPVGATVTLVVGAAGSGGLHFRQAGGDGGVTQIYVNGTLVVSADSGKGGHVGGVTGIDGGDFAWGGAGGAGYPAGGVGGYSVDVGDGNLSYPIGNQGGNGASSSLGVGGTGVGGGTGGSAVGNGSGGAGGGFDWGWRGSGHSSAEYNGWHPAGNGSPGWATLEFFNPNSVVLRTDFDPLVNRVTSLENRLTSAGIA